MFEVVNEKAVSPWFLSVIPNAGSLGMDTSWPAWGSKLLVRRPRHAVTLGGSGGSGPPSFDELLDPRHLCSQIDQSPLAR